MSECSEGVVVGFEKRLVACFDKSNKVSEVGAGAHNLTRGELSHLTALSTQLPCFLVKVETLNILVLNDFPLSGLISDKHIIYNTLKRRDLEIQWKGESHGFHQALDFLLLSS